MSRKTPILQSLSACMILVCSLFVSALVSAIPAPAAAQTMVGYIDAGGVKRFVDITPHGLPVNCILGCSGSGGSLTGTVNLTPLSGLTNLASQGFSFTGSGGARVTLNDPISGFDVSFTNFSPATSNITAVDAATTSTAGQSSVNRVTGTPTANSAVTFAIDNLASLNLSISGTFVATGQIEGSADSGVSYHLISGLLRGTALRVSAFTGQGTVSLEVAGYDHVRVRSSAYTSGTMTVKASGSANTGGVKLLSPASLVDSAGGALDNGAGRLNDAPGINSSGSTPLYQADDGAILNMTTATTTKIITGVASKKTYIGHFRVWTNGTTTAKFVTGTGTNCGTGTADLSETWDMTAQNGNSPGNGLGTILKPVAASTDVCVTNGQAVHLNVGVAFTQAP